MDTGTRPDASDEDAADEDVAAEHAADVDAADENASEVETDEAVPGGATNDPTDPRLNVDTTTPTETTRRLNPRIRVVWLFRAAMLAAVVGGVAFGAGRILPTVIPDWVPALLAGVVFLVTGTHALLRYRYWRFELRADAIYLERGVFTRVRTVVPFVRIQHVDSRRGPLERVVGLASCVVYSAGSRGADVRIPGLTPDDADDLREDLKRLAIGAEGEDGV